MAQTVKITPSLGTLEFIGNISLAASTSAIFTGNSAGSITLTFPTSQGISITGFVTVNGNITATSFIKSGGTSSQFLKADGSVDSNAYILASRTLSINGVSYDLSADRIWSIGLDSVTNINATTTNALTVGGITSPYFQFNKSIPVTPVEGMAFWESDNTFPTIQINANLSGRIFEDEFWCIKNQTGSLITKGTVVMAVGTVGASARILGAPMVANGSVSQIYILGVAAENIPNGADGSVVRTGKIRGINTAVWPDGTVLYADPANPGQLTSTVPQAPNLKLAVAFVVHSATNGVLAIRVQTGSDLYEDNRVQIVTALANGQLLRYNSTSARWENWAPNFALAATTINIAGTANQVNVTGGTQDLSGNRTWTLSLPQNIHTAATPTFGGATLNGAVGIRAASSASAATQFLVVTADPSSTTRTIVTRTPSQVLTDIGAAPTSGSTNYIQNQFSSAQSNSEAWLSGRFQAGNLRIDTNTISSQNTNGNIILSPNGTGVIGIGTTSPNTSFTLDISGIGLRVLNPTAGGNVNLTLSTTNSDAIGSNADVNLNFGPNVEGGFTVPSSRITGTNQGNGRGMITFWTRPGSGDQLQRLQIDSFGNVNVLDGNVTFANNYGLTWDSGTEYITRKTGSDSIFIGLNGTDRFVVTTNGIQIRATSTSSIATQIPVFTADPTSTLRTLVTRTPVQLLTDTSLFGHSVEPFGQYIGVGGGSDTVLASGEARTQYEANVLAGVRDTETLWFLSDQGINFEVGIQSGWSSRISAMNIASSGVVTLNNLRISANTLSSVNTNGNIILTPNGTGYVRSNSSVEIFSQDTQSWGGINGQLLVKDSRDASVGIGGKIIFGNNNFGTGAIYALAEGAGQASSIALWNRASTGLVVERLRISSTGALRLNSYGSGTFTGTATQKLAVDTNGNVIEIPIGSGPVDGNGTANFVTKWSDTDTITNSQIFDNGTNVGIGTTSPSTKFNVLGTSTFFGNGAHSLGWGNTSELGRLTYIDTNIPAIFSSTGTGLVLGGTTARQWTITSTGIFESTGAQTIRSSTGDLTLATNAGNGNVIVSPHGTGFLQVDAIQTGSTTKGITLRNTNGWGAAINWDIGTYQTARIFSQNDGNGGRLYFMTADTAGALQDRWSITNTGILQSNGAQTIRTSTGNLTLATNGANGNIVLSPNGTGFTQSDKNFRMLTNILQFADGQGGLNEIQGSIARTGTLGGANTMFRMMSQFDDVVIQAGVNDSNLRTITLRSGLTGHGLTVNTNGHVGIGSTSTVYGRLQINATTHGTHNQLAFSVNDGTNTPRAIISHVTSASVHRVEFGGSFSTGSGFPNWQFTTGWLQVGNIRIDTNTISSQNTNGNIVLSPNGTGAVQYNPANGTGDFVTVDGSNLLRRRTAAQVLTDIGAAPASGSGSYIQNQISSAQSANMWINNTARFDGEIRSSHHRHSAWLTLTGFSTTNDTGYFNLGNITDARLFYFEIEIISTWNQSRSFGLLRKGFTVRTNTSGGALNTTDTRQMVLDDIGHVSDTYVIGNVEKLGDMLRVPIARRTGAGDPNNTVRIRCTVYSENVGDLNGWTFSVTPPAPVGTLDREYTTLNHRLGINLGYTSGVANQPTEVLHVGGNVLGGGWGQFGNLRLTTNTLSSQNTNGNIILSPNGTGNVGIGTTTPDYRLSINGDGIDLNGVGVNPVIRLRASSLTTSIFEMGRIGLGTYFTNIAAGPLEFSTTNLLRWAITSVGILESNGAQTIRTSTGNLTLSTDGGNGNIILSPNGSGNVGIGTTSPSQKLHVEGGNILLVNSGNQPHLYFTNTSQFIRWTGSNLQYSAAGHQFLNRVEVLSGNYLSVRNTDNTTVYGFDNVGATNNSILRFRNITANRVDAVIDNSGNVGIGTITPSTRTEIVGGVNSSEDTILQIRSNFTGNNTATILRFGNSTATSVPQGSAEIVALRRNALVSGDTDLIFRTSDGALIPERMRIMYNGNVGIGITTPSQVLHTFSDTKDNNILLGGPSAYNQGIFFGALDYGIEKVANNATTRIKSANRIIFNTGVSGGFERMRIDVDGNVGIGTASPTTALHVVGITHIAGGGSSTFYGTDANGSYARTFTVNVYSFRNSAGSTVSSFNTSTGALRLNSYGSGTFTGTTTQRLGVDANGNVVEIPIGSGPVDGNGTANFVTKWSDSDTITNSIIFDNGTNVGIGTTSPSEKLHIAGGKQWIEGGMVDWNTTTPGTTRGSLHIGQVAAASNAGGAITFGARDTSSGSNAQAGIYTTTDGTYGTRMYFATSNNYATGAVTRMTILQAGNVGIGNTSPTARLQVQGQGTTSSTIALNTTDSGGSSLLIVRDDGNVGIGTTAPGAKLQIASNALGGTLGNQTIQTIFSTSNANSSLLEVKDVRTSTGTDWTSAAKRIQMRVDSTYMGYIQFNGTGNNSGISFGAGSTTTAPGDVAEHLRITAGGLVGIGVTNPAAKLNIVSANDTTALRINAGPSAIYNFTANSTSGYETTFNMTNTGLSIGHNSNSRSLSLTTASTSRIFITGDGLVGIGTTSPTHILQVHTTDTAGSTAQGATISVRSATSATVNRGGSIIFGDTGAVDRAMIKGAFAGTTGSEGYMALSTRTASSGLAEVMRLTGIGNVGIGTTNPLFKLHVLGTGAGDSTFTGGVLIDNNNATDGEATLAFRVNSMVAGGNYWLTGLNQTNNYSIAYGTSFTDASTLFRVQSNGNVGIGTTSPAFKLDVVGEGKVTGKFRVGGAVMLAEPGTGVLLFGSEGGSQTAIYSSSVERIRINGSGNVGIGTTSPDYPLTFANTLGSKINFYQGQNWGIGLQSNLVQFINNSTVGDWAFGSGTSAAFTPIFTIKGTGNVGIGTTSPSERLHVVGRARIATMDNAIGNFVTTSATGVLTQRSAAEVRNDIQVSQYSMTSSTSWVAASTSGWFRLASTSGAHRGGIRIIISYIGGNFAPETYIINVGKDWANTGSLRVDVRNASSNSVRGVRIIQDIVNTSIYHVEANFVSSSNTHQFQLYSNNTEGLNDAWTVTTTSPLVASTNGTVITLVNVFGSGVYSSDPYNIQNIRIDTNTISSRDTNGNIILSPNGTGAVQYNPTNGTGDFITVDGSNLLRRRTAAQVLTDIGAAPASGGGNYIQNQFTAAQTTSEAWLSGRFQAGNLRIDTNTISSQNTNGHIVLSPNGTGNVGIGTTTPAEKLRVNGTFSSNAIWTNTSSVTFWGSYSTAYGVLTWDTGVAAVRSSSGNRLDLGASGSTHITINTSGDVGVGTTSPTHRFTVNRTITTPIAYFGTTFLNQSNINSLIVLQSGTIPQGGSDVSGEAGFIFNHAFGTGGVNGNSNGGFIKSIRELAFATTAQVNTSLIFATSLANVDTERMRITSSGNVGIGQTSPTQRLQVYEGGNTAYKTYTVTNPGAILTSYQSGFSPFMKTTDLVAGSDGTTPSEIRFFTRTDGSASIAERLRITSTGRIGINTTSPVSTLDINQPGDGFLNGITVARSGANRGTIFLNSANDTFNIARGSDTPAISITNSLNVGIGATNPASKLEVSDASYNGLTLSRTATSAGTYIASRGWDTANVLRTSALIEFAQTSASGASNGRINFFTYISNTANLRWSILNDGIWESNGTQTIRTSTGTLNITTQAGDGNINLNPHGIGIVNSTKRLFVNQSINYGIDGNLSVGNSTQWGLINMGGVGNAYVGVIRSSGGTLIGNAIYARYLDNTDNSIIRAAVTRASGPSGIMMTSNGNISFIGLNSSITLDQDMTNSYSWRILPTGSNWIFESNGASIIRTSTGNLTIATNGGNGNIILSPNGTGALQYNPANGTGDFVTVDGSNLIRRRTAAQVLTDIGGQAALTNPVTGTGVTGQVSFWNGTNTQAGDNGLFWDNTNKRLGIGITNPSEILHVNKVGTAENVLLLSVNSTSVGATPFLEYRYNNGGVNTRIARIGALTQSGGGGDILFQTSSSGSNAYETRWSILRAGILESNGTQTIRTSTGNLTIATNAGNGHILLTPNNLGNVGIGTTSPLAPLHISSKNGSTDTNLQRWEYNGSSAYQLILKQTVTSGVVRWNFSQINNSVSFDDVLVLDRGNVGIGTTSPLFKLHVLGTGAGDGTFTGGILVENNNATAGEAATSYRVSSTPASNYWFTGLNQANAYDIGYGTSFINAGTALRVTTDLRVGIGTVTPTTKLQVVDTTDIPLEITRSSNANSGIKFSNTGSNFSILYGGSNAFALRYFYNATEYLTIATNGNVGIGTTSPSQKLDVNGNIAITKALLSNQENLDVDSGAIRVIATISSTLYDAAFFDFVIKKGTNRRAGTVYVTHNGTSVEFTETSTNDLGTTSDVTLSVDLSGGNIRLLATTLSNDWIIKTLVRGI